MAIGVVFVGDDRFRGRGLFGTVGGRGWRGVGEERAWEGRGLSKPRWYDRRLGCARGFLYTLRRTWNGDIPDSGEWTTSSPHLAVPPRHCQWQSLWRLAGSMSAKPHRVESRLPAFPGKKDKSAVVPNQAGAVDGMSREFHGACSCPGFCLMLGKLEKASVAGSRVAFPTCNSSV